MNDINYDAVPWTPFEVATLPDHPFNDHPVLVVLNSRYQVNVYRVDGGPIFGDIAWLSIKARDKQARHDWRDMQRIKNEIIGPEFEAVEIFPAESRMVDSANQYHMWVFTSGFRLPFGFNERLVAEGDWKGSRQRPFEPDARPADCLSAADLDRAVQQAQQAKRERSTRIVMAAVRAVVGDSGG